MMNTCSKKTIGYILLLTILSTSCVKSPSGEDPGGNGTVNTFDFATTVQYPVRLLYNLKKYPILVEIYDKNPLVQTIPDDEESAGKDNTLEPVYRGITDSFGYINGTLSLPSHVKTVWLYTNYAGVPSSIAVPVQKSGVQFTLETRDIALASTKTTSATYTHPKGMMVLGTWNAEGLPDYLLPAPNIHPEGLMNDISSALPIVYPGDKTPSLLNTYLKEEHELNLHIVKKTKLTMVFAHEYATKKNTIGYYHYPTGTPPENAAEANIIIALPNVSYPDYKVGENGESLLSGGPLSSGDQLELKYWDGTTFQDEFPANTTVGFVLSESAFSNGNVRDNRKLYFSDSPLNVSESNPNCLQHCLAFESKNRNLVVYTFEDTGRSASLTSIYPGGNFRDNIFYIRPSENAPFNTGNMLQLPGGNEPEPEENTITYAGTLSFEDIWPYMGDYDMNDVVVEYQCTHYRNANNRVVRTSDLFTFRHNGGKLAAGFGYQLTGLHPNTIQHVSITPAPGGSPVFTLNEKGLENGNEATVIVFENTLKIKEGDVFQVETVFTSPVEDKEITPPYNPFIVINSDQKRGYELHLPNHTPTALMDKTLLGYGHDKSDVSKGLFFVSESQYPFAIHIPVIPFDCPAEMQRIDAKYPQFLDWVQSNGTSCQDWYLHPAK